MKAYKKIVLSLSATVALQIAASPEQAVAQAGRRSESVSKPFAVTVDNTQEQKQQEPKHDTKHVAPAEAQNVSRAIHIDLQPAAQPVVQPTAQPSTAEAIVPKINVTYNTKADVANFVSDIDLNIPASSRKNDDCFALIIANETYRSPVPDVPFAMNDGKSFAAYCEKTLGIPARQIIFIENGTGNQINEGIERIAGLLKTADGAGKAIVYYAGHGIPNVETSEPYIVPTDANPTRFSQLISLHGMYKRLGAMSSESVLVVLDACFSGTRRSGEMLLAGTRSIKIKIKEGELTGNMVVMSATDGYQTAQPIREQKHGLFTYYLLKTLQESKGEITLGEWFDKAKRTVARESILNAAEQTPTINVSHTIQENWNNIKLNK